MGVTQFFWLKALSDAVLLVGRSHVSDFDFLVNDVRWSFGVSACKPSTRATKCLRLTFPSFADSHVNFLSDDILVAVIVHGGVNGTHHVSFTH